MEKIAEDYVKQLANDKIIKEAPNSPRVYQIPKAIEYKGSSWVRVVPRVERVFKGGENIILHGTKQVKQDELFERIFNPFIDGWPYSWRPFFVEHKGDNWGVELRRCNGVPDVVIEGVTKTLEEREGYELDDWGYSVQRHWEVERIPLEKGEFENTFLVRGTVGIPAEELQKKLEARLENPINPWCCEIIETSENLGLKFSMPSREQLSSTSLHATFAASLQSQ